ncbi:LysM peptidoglycan-binding domain-containing protein [Pedobacter gandavensis]|uniref:LysM peptidoglycan-binding domain-containing protein n=1 Tax=Pedobacter TaxID=84567 RepID=UPI001C9A1276|nr:MULTISPECIES: LysM peptidoglycan-binding domain-containing protein [Pedobacter]WGQ11596.1 LysM peptidoglycan-binding domain-containing protein [Pedobacter gandavensis]
MYKYYIVSLFAVLLKLPTANANTNTRDSIGVENRNGKKLIIHEVAAKDTYYAIGRRYNVTPKDIMTFNDNKFLQIGVIIKVPTNIPFTGPAAEKNPLNAAHKNVIPKKNENTDPDGIFIEHIVQKKENLGMLAKKYNTTVEEIKKINNLKTINLSIGQVLKMPANEGAETEQTTTPATVAPAVVAQQPVKIEKTVPADTKKKEEILIPIFPKKQPNPAAAVQNQPAAVHVPDDSSADFIEHTVASNETLYSIATRYKLSMDQVKAKNNLTGYSLRVGQKLLIKGQYPQKPAPSANHQPENPVDTLNSIKNPSLRLPASRYGLNQMDEKGTGIWIADPDLDPSKMLVLHRSAPIGTVMKITNPMSNRSTFAKVVGKFTENESTKDVIIVMTKAVADALGAIDKRFFCNLTYGGQDNEQ